MFDSAKMIVYNTISNHKIRVLRDGEVMLDIDLSNRQKLILKAIIEEYVSTGEPVGSKVLTEKPYL